MTREPFPSDARQTGDMQHQTHDHALIAGLAAGDLTGSDLARARTHLDECSSCAELHSDLIAIAAATRSLPNLATAPRDFRIDAAQAARLSRRSWLRTMLAPFGAARSATRPLAAGFTSLGLVGLLAVAILPGLGGAAFAPTSGQNRDLASAPEATIESVEAPAAGGPGGAPEASDQTFGGIKDGSTEGTGNGTGSGQGDTSQIHAESTGAPLHQTDGPLRLSTNGPLNVLFAGSLALVAIGLALFGLRYAARRVR